MSELQKLELKELIHLLLSDNITKYGKNRLVLYVETLQQRIDKAINDLEIIIDIIRQQPTENDEWIISRLEANKSILKGEE